MQHGGLVAIYPMGGWSLFVSKLVTVAMASVNAKGVARDFLNFNAC